MVTEIPSTNVNIAQGRKYGIERGIQQHRRRPESEWRFSSRGGAFAKSSIRCYRHVPGR